MTSKTVVIASDIPDITDRFASALEGADHHVAVVGTAGELLARLRVDGGRIDLVIVDLRLASGTGPAFVRSIRDLGEGRLPIIVLSGSVAHSAEIRELAALGVAGYVNEHCAVQQIVPSLTPHLFPDNFNRRSSPRLALGIPVSYRLGDTVTAALTLSLSKGGLAIRTMSPLDLLAKVRVRFRLPASKRDIEAESRVTWTDRRVGMGLQFERVDSAGQAAIDEFVDRQVGTRRAPATQEHEGQR